MIGIATPVSHIPGARGLPTPAGGARASGFAALLHPAAGADRTDHAASFDGLGMFGHRGQPGTANPGRAPSSGISHREAPTPQAGDAGLSEPVANRIILAEPVPGIPAMGPAASLATTAPPTAMDSPFLHAAPPRAPHGPYGFGAAVWVQDEMPGTAAVRRSTPPRPASSARTHDAVACAVSGEEALKIVARLSGEGSEDRALLRRRLAELAAEFGARIDELQLNGSPQEPVFKTLTGANHGHRAR